MKKQDKFVEWNDIVKSILENEEFQKRKTFHHHGNTSVYEHSVKVSKKAYSLAKLLHVNCKDAAIAGLLHDFYTTPWQEDTTIRPFFQKHGFTHARIALENSRKHFPNLLNKKIENAIVRHMFPLNITPPKYLVGYIVTIADKICSLDMISYIFSSIKLPHFRFLKKG